MTNPTGAHPVSDALPDDPVSTRELARNTAHQLHDYARSSGFHDLAVAADMLGITSAEVSALVADGALTAVTALTCTLICPASLQEHAVARLTADTTRAMRQRAALSTALRAYLAATPVTAHWAQARTERRPLVCNRQGRRVWINFGIRYHSVVFSASWLATWAAANLDGAVLPVGSALVEALVSLGGVSPHHHATALVDDGASHRLSGWVRVDPQVWPVVVPDDVDALVRTPPGAA
jgi:hypothetical protein